ncbi:AraC family transcriptional regulator [Chitinophaga sp. Cy-1792]|uniref:helix-turn-helix domain-containing protein n=1 Tax=Chitinophaga sp. Cy-1792 TaxID=2608339 RepID=UPI001422C48D|nr:helix-turn-helix domain-containing protein [Chitinophaga sp. Cy-1792]NIG54816.1 AraC family transcriptional regulator [Chitinophaga sp. Cy-1792]
MPRKTIHHVNTISEFHKLRKLPAPEHPLISVIDLKTIDYSTAKGSTFAPGFYSISLKRNPGAKIKYGQQQYDFDEGLMFFIAPGQVFSIETDEELAAKHSGLILQVHPDFLWNTPLATKIRQYEYFDYAVNEALFLSEKEEAIITGIMRIIEQELHNNIDKFSEQIIIAQLEVLLAYAERFYQRQFITRKISNHKILEKLEALLDVHFSDKALSSSGLPAVQDIAAALHLSPNYLSGLLKSVTGKSTQQHIHEKIIAVAKQQLSATELSVSEIAYELGFEHPQSFSKLFKARTNLSPLAFRKMYNN